MRERHGACDTSLGNNLSRNWQKVGLQRAVHETRRFTVLHGPVLLLSIITSFSLLTTVEFRLGVSYFPLLFEGCVKKSGSPLPRGMRCCAGRPKYRWRKTFEGTFVHRLFQTREIRSASFSASSTLHWNAVDESKRIGAGQEADRRTRVYDDVGEGQVVRSKPTYNSLGSATFVVLRFTPAFPR